jgi:hypothetical protein
MLACAACQSADQKACRAGEDFAAWQACNRACTDSNDQEACAKAKLMHAQGKDKP